MKEGNIYIYQNIGALKSIVGVCYTKERFIHKSFVNKSFILMACNEDFRKELPFELIKKYQKKEIEYNINSFTQEYSTYIYQIHQYEEKNQYKLSWLEVIQIAYIMKNFDKKIEESFLLLKDFYLFLKENF